MKLVSENPLSGVRVKYDYDEASESHVLVTEIDRRLSQATVERNKQLEGHGMGKEWRLAASIPPEIQFEWMDKYGVEFWNPDHQDGVKRLLNSNEYRYLRVNHFIL